MKGMMASLKSFSVTSRLQAGLAIALLLGSLGTLIYNAYTVTVIPRQEWQVRTALREASRLMAGTAGTVLRVPVRSGPEQLEDLHRLLSEVTDRVLTTFPGMEGGFYLGDVNRFSGYGFPTGVAGHPKELHRTDPPPLEAPLIRLQALQSLSERTPLFTVRDVGPSRVMIVTEAIGSERPAHAATWAMVRLTGPEHLQGRLRRYQLSVGLALAGLALSLALTFTLTRSLAAQRASQERLREELRRSEQLAALGKLLAGVAHEIRNPLAGIRSTVQLWQRLRDPDRVATSIDAVVQATERLNEILTRLLHFARTEHAERRPTQVNELMVETTKLVEAQAQSQGVRIQCDLDPQLPIIPASPASLRQVFLNLVTNALQAMPDGGVLRCRTRHDRANHMAEIIVSDTGLGVSRQDREHLFEPFFTTRPEGTGLGLALCREIVHQHGGTIELASQDQAGAAFCIVLPTGER